MTDLDWEALDLSPRMLVAVRDALTADITAGLNDDNAGLRCLPFPWSLDGVRPVGHTVALDLGGTNARATRVHIDESGVSTPGPLVEERFTLRAPPANGAALFGWLASMVVHAGVEPGVPLGFCFSYPAASLDDGDATLLAWTKGVDLKDVVGQRVGAALADHCALQNAPVGTVVVLNDTLACLFGGLALNPSARPRRTIGLIVGTGTNAAAVLPVQKAGRAGRWLPVNLEWGNFRPPACHAIDEIVDAASTNPHAQRFEKMFSGAYLPPLMVALGVVDSPPESAEALVRWRDQEPASRRGQASALLLRRAAMLTAAGLAAVAQVLDDAETGAITVAAEGSLFWGDPQFARHVEKSLSVLAPQQSFCIARVDGANLVGAALAALVVHQATR